MFDSDGTEFPISRRKLLHGVGGIGAATMVSGTATASGDPGDGGGDPPSGGDGGEGDGGNVVATVTLITGQTVQVHEHGGRRQYVVDSDDDEAIRSFEVEEGANVPAGTYIVPADADLTTLSPLLFNVDLLVDQEVTDEETDAIPVILELAVDVSDGPGTMSAAAGGFTSRTALTSIDAVAGDIAKEGSRLTTQDVTATSVVERVHLDTLHEALLDTSADAVDAPAAREEYGMDGSGVSVAILDTGIDADHPDFGDRVVHQRDFSGDGVADGNGHGTHCAGIAAGAGDASGGDYVGMAPGADLVNIKVLGNDGNGRLSQIAAGIEHAVDQGADIISMSLGGPTQEDGPMVQAVEAAVDAGVTAAVAAGNDYNYQTIGSPGIAESAITVGASDESGDITWFSSGGPTPYEHLVKPEVAAPGSGITSTGSEDAGQYPYTDKSGTSMSTPHVAGIAALLLEDDGDRTPADVKDALISTADPLDGEDVYKQGGGVVNAMSALDADLRVHGAVANLGLYEESGTATASVDLENTGSDTIEVDVAASLENIQSGDDISGNVSVTPSTVTVDAGTTETVEFTVEVGDAFGFNSGVLTFDTGDATHHAIFGFVRGIEVTVDKIAHEDSSSVASDDLLAYAHDGSGNHLGFAAFDEGGEYSFTILDDGGEFLLWSMGTLDDGSGEPTWTVTDVDISPDSSHFTLDESATVPRELDTSQVSEHEPFEMRRFDATLYATFEEISYSTARSFIGDHGIRNAHVTPLSEDDATNVATSYLMASENPDGENTLDSPVGYHLFYGSLAVDGPRDVVTVDPDELATEEIEYHRTYEGQLFGVSPGMYPDDFASFPTPFLVTFLTDISDDRVEQTWYRNEQAVYAETWYDQASFSGDYKLKRAKDFNPEAGETYHQPFNAEPFGNGLPIWELDDGTLSINGQWYTDNADEPFAAFEYAFDGPYNEYAISVDGEVVQSESTYYWLFGEYADPVVEVPDIPAGSTIDVSMDGGVLGATPRKTTTTSDYRVSYRPGTANAPPQVASVDVAGLTTFNQVAAGRTLAFVEIDHEASGVNDFQAYYAASGAVSATPFESTRGWREAEVVYSDGDLFGVALDTAGHTGSFELAFEAVDAAGNRARSTTFDALQVSSGADRTVPIAVKPDEVDVGSNQSIVVRIGAGSGVSAEHIVVDSLRFGDAEAVNSGGGAPAWKSRPVGNGGLQVMFRAGETELTAGESPAAGQLVGALEDGTRISGADVIENLTGDE